MSEKGVGLKYRTIKEYISKSKTYVLIKEIANFMLIIKQTPHLFHTKPQN